MTYKRARERVEKIWSEFIDLERELRPLYGKKKVEALCIKELCDWIMQNFCILSNKLGELEVLQQ